MQILWGALMSAIGIFMLVCGTLKTEFIVYRLLVARSRIALGEGDAVHRFYQLVGIILIALGILWALGIIWQQ
ncbi:MAG: hypothetical protein R3C53_04905 [Pirellulaceae bacterium]